MSLQDDIRNATQSFDPTTGVGVLCFGGDEVFFQGHFPGNPILPAVVQIAAALRFASEMTGRSLRLVEVTRAKFTRPTGPGTVLTLSVQVDQPEPELTRVRATLQEAGAEVAAFTLRASG